MHALTFHGGRLDEAARRYPQAVDRWIDLSTGINPARWRPSAEPAIDLHALPSPTDLNTLIAAASAAFGAPGLPITALPGSEIGLRLLAHLNLPKPFRLLGPSYRSHHAALPGAECVSIDRIGEGGTVLLANPNNPDGRLIDPGRLLLIARALAAKGGVLVVDEAFADAVEGASILPLLSGEDRVLVFRSFGKFYGLAGVRLGFACGAGDMVGRLADMLGSWPVSATAIGLGTDAYRDAPWQAAARIRLARDVACLDQLLAAHGFEPQGACPLFRMVETERAPLLFDRLARAGILTRPFDYAPNWLRFGLPSDAGEFARLDRALSDG